MFQISLDQGIRALIAIPFAAMVALGVIAGILVVAYVAIATRD